MEQRARAMSRLPQRESPALLAWVPVAGPDGRTRMEMRWHASGPRTSISVDRFREAA